MSAASRAQDPRAEGSTVLVRRATGVDLPAVVSIERASFSDPWPDSAFKDALRAEHLYFSVAEAPSGAVVGYVIGWFAAGDGEIANIAVAPEARGHGIGARLLDDALGAARRAGSEALHLEVRESNMPARRLYASRHFGPVGTRRGYYRDPVEDAIVLRCPLRGGTD